MPLSEADALADTLAHGLFSADAAERKRTRAALSAHSNAAVAAFFASDKRSVHTVSDGAKLAKILKEYAALGVNHERLVLARLKALAPLDAYLVEPWLQAALSLPGLEAQAFEALATATVVYLPKPKRALPPGLSKLRALQRLRVTEGTLKTDANVAEIAQIPQRIELELWVKDVNLALFAQAAENVRALMLRGSFSGLNTVDALRGWKHLTALNLEGTAVSDLSPLAALPLTQLNVSESKVHDLSAIAHHTGLTRLGLRRLAVTDFSPLAGFRALEHLDAGFTALRDLSVLRELSRLSSLHLWGTPVASLEPLVGLPIETLDMNYTARPDLSPLIRIPTLKYLHIIGAADTTRGLADLVAARPDVSINR